MASIAPSTAETGMPVPTSRRTPVLLVVAVFLAGTLLATRPSPRPSTLGKGLEWTVTRTVRRTRFTAVARELSRSVVVAQASEPAPSRGRRIGEVSRPHPDSQAPIARVLRHGDRESSPRPPGSTRLRC